MVGCGGGGDGSNPGQSTTTPIAEDFVQVVARTGPIVAVRVGETVNLDGSKSFVSSSSASSFTSSSDPLTFDWSFTSKPLASSAVLQGPTLVNPSFVADAKGVYIVQLVVSAEGISSQRSVKSIVATVVPERLTGPFNHQGLSSDCVICHNGDIDLVSGSGGGKIPGQTAIHVATSKSCQTCHTPQGFTIIPYVDHAEVFGDCSVCHNGILAIGKSDFHVPTDVECDECHNTKSFLELEADGSFDHSSIARACIGCHNGIVAVGKHEAHIQTDVECGFCHTTVDFKDAYPDHTGSSVVGNRCDSCHNDTTAGGQTVGHPVTNVDCDVCHSIVSFSMGGVFNHRVVDPLVQACESCHNDSNSINAPGKAAAATHPPTSSDCGSCHSIESFQNAFLDHSDPAVVSARCDSCHGVTAVGKPVVGHLATTDDCVVCHSPGTFATGVFDHVGIVDNCASCHDNVITVGKLIDHMPTTADCSVCHTTATFAGAVFNHVGIDTTNCALCHDGAISVGKSSNHLPTTLDCSSCHDINNFTSFAGVTFSHLGIDNNNCAVCHASGIATPKSVNHLPAEKECSSCHDSTDTFVTNTFLTSVHQGLTRGCEGCHVTQFFPSRPALTKLANHVPTSQDCHVCHTNTAFIPKITPFLHTGITGNCVSCHDGSADNVAAGALGKAQSTNLHPVTTDDCGSCHAIGNNFLDGTFDHAGIVDNCSSCHGDNPTNTPVGPSKNAGHVTTTQDCSVCHVVGTFTTAVFNHAGITDNCASCHDGADAVGTVKSVSHLPTTQDCSVCHNTDAFAGARFDHQGVVDNCSSCHNGTTAIGKVPPPDHVPTNSECNVCHQTSGFIPAIFEHTGIVDNCSSCHGAGFAQGKSSTHVATIKDCGVCHNTRTFVGAVFDHTGIVDNCSSCHGVTATGKHGAHIQTAQDCHQCHTTATFVGGTWAHDSSTAGRCDDCHNDNGGGATAKSQGHLSTNVQCDACHSTNGWAPTIFAHDPQGDYPGNHRRDPGCVGCHGNTISTSIPYPSSRYAPFCAACHERDFRSQGDHKGGRSGTVEQNKDCSNGGRGCHRVSDSNWD
jgi:hypothetical protein